MVLRNSVAFIFSSLAFLIQVEGKSFWSSQPAVYSDIIRQAYPVGNGKLGALLFGPAGEEKLNLNIDSLWSGGPFEIADYAGGNPNSSQLGYVEGVREWTFENGVGNVTQLLRESDGYGSYRVFGNLSIKIDGIDSSEKYKRSLDLRSGVHTTTFKTNNGSTFTSTVYCSYPSQVCVYQLSSSAYLPGVSITLENQLVEPSLEKHECGNNSVKVFGVTQLGPPLGMKYTGVAQVLGSNMSTTCVGTTSGTMVVPASPWKKDLTVIFSADTNYDMTKGNPASNYSFLGEDPTALVEKRILAAAASDPQQLLDQHLEDFKLLESGFKLNIPDIHNSKDIETSTLLDRYNQSSNGDPFIESLLFDFGRYLLITSSRDNSLPANLQGRWSHQLGAAWSGDYHANINLQMNYWGADQTGLGSLQDSLWDYIAYTWVPRGTETATIIYGGDGWTTHDEMNIFGHTGMKSYPVGDGAIWANYPASAAWMMQHVFDHYDYSSDIRWLKDQGYPLIKGVAQFWLSQLQPDSFFDDGSLVVNPCNSPEHGPTTFACTHWQQLIHQVFEAVLELGSLVNESKEFITATSSALEKLDKGLYIGEWGEIKEFKLPDSYGYDVRNDTHRHLSQLVGWYPGYSISSFADGYTNKSIQDAVTTSLWSRGPGIGSDANSGWEKIWRSACWARLNNTERAFFELRYTIWENIAQNGLSMYSAHNEPFQIDANFGIVGAILSMLVVDLPQKAYEKRTRTVVLGPSIPSSWGGGNVVGLRLRGGGVVDFSWDDEGLVDSVKVIEQSRDVVLVNKKGKRLR